MQILRTFRFFGPNCHTDFPACGWLVTLSEEERKALRENADTLREQLIATLEGSGIQPRHLASLRRPLPSTARARFAQLFNSTAIVLQRHAGHRPYRARKVISKETPWVRALFEVEDHAAGAAAGRLALYLMSQALPALTPQAANAAGQVQARDLVERFRQKFSKTAMSRETRAMIRAATKAGVPWMRLDQPPFRPLREADGSQRNGTLLLGQGIHRRIIAGTLCIDRDKHVAPFLDNRVSIARLLAKLGARLPHDGREPPVAYDLLGAIRLAERFAYPLAIRPVLRAGGEGIALKVKTLEELIQAVTRAQTVSREFLVQKHVRGKTWKILVSDGRAVGFLRSNRSIVREVEPAASITALAERIARQLRVGILVLTVVTPDISRPLEETGGVVVDLDLAPELDRLLKPQSRYWKPVMDGFIGNLFPAGTPSRIPIIAVAGVSSARTAQLIEAVARHSGVTPSLSCSDGLYVGGDRVRRNRGPKRLREMHHRLIRKRQTEMAVMEFQIGQLRQGGFPFDWCNIGVVGGVSVENAQPGWETPSQQAELLRAVLQRARDGVVLNADDPYTPEMMRHLDGRKIYLTSVHRPAAEVCACGGNATGFVTVERATAGDRIVIQEEDDVVDLMGTAEISAASGATAKPTWHGILQAIAAGRLLNIPLAGIRAALAEFE